MFWDAYYKGLMADYPKRMEFIEQVAKRSRTGQAALIELRVAAALDSWLYFNDLWHTVGYTTLFSTWNYLTMCAPVHCERKVRDATLLPDFMRPRRRYADPVETDSPEPAERRFTRIDYRAATANLRGLSQRECPTRTPDGHLVRDVRPARAMAYDETVTAWYPPEQRRNVLLALIHQNPYFSKSLEPDEQDCYRGIYTFAQGRLSIMGFRSILVGPELEESDFYDNTHLAVDGGMKLAAKVAPAVREMAYQLGYRR
jgi:hypothetical protein